LPGCMPFSAPPAWGFSGSVDVGVVVVVGSSSSGGGGGVVAITYPIHARMRRTAATATRAVITRTRRGLTKMMSQLYMIMPAMLAARMSAPTAWSLFKVRLGLRSSV
jgi:hypothetical protein